MAPTPRQIGFIDRIDLSGWLLMLAGAFMVGATVLIPAYMDRQDLHRQTDSLATQLELLEQQQRSHQEFQTAITHNDPQLLKRLGWEYLNLKPATAQRSFIDADSADSWQKPSDVVHTLPATPTPEPRGHMASSLLIRHTTGQSRPWVMALGAWLILMGLLSNPGRRQTEETD